jgi:DNA-directed RNA polymerase specialized sigma subunit
MRRSLRRLNRIIKKIDRGAHDAELKHRIAALVLAYKRAWSAEQIADHFNWPPDEVAKWLEAGKFGRAFGPNNPKDFTQLN